MKRLMILSLLMPVVLAGYVQTAQVDVETAYTNPYPVAPGNNFVLALQVSNTGGEKAEDIFIEPEMILPFTLLETAKKEIKTLQPGDVRIIEYHVFVDSSAISTVYKIPVHIVFDAIHDYKKNIQIRVQGIPRFKLLEMKPQPELEPGGRSTVTVSIKNVGTGDAKRVSVIFGSSSFIQPIFSQGNIYIEGIKPGEERDINFEVLVDSDAEYGVYSGEINVSYEDESGNILSDKFDVGLFVRGEPMIEVIKTKTDKEKGELSVEIVNSGSAKTTGIKAELEVANETFDVDYITQIKIDSHTTVKFKMPAKERIGRLKLYYKGPDNKEFSQVELITWDNTSKPPYILIGLGVLVVVFIVWKSGILKFKKK